MDALTKTLGYDPEPYFGDNFRNWLGLIVFAVLAAFLYWDSCRAKAEE